VAAETKAIASESGMRIALYARVSTKDKGREYENQLRELREFVTRKAGDGWVAAGEYVDKASGKTAGRPQFRKLFEDASRRQFDLVLFWSLDRFSREAVLETLQHLSGCPATASSGTATARSTCGRLALSRGLAILAAVAKQEHIRLSERVHAGLKRARAQLCWSVPVPPRGIERVMKLRERGLSIREIAGETGASAP